MGEVGATRIPQCSFPEPDFSVMSTIVPQVGWPNVDLKSNIRFVLASYFNSENLELEKVVHSKLAKIFAQPHNGV